MAPEIAWEYLMSMSTRSNMLKEPILTIAIRCCGQVARQVASRSWDLGTLATGDPVKPSKIHSNRTRDNQSTLISVTLESESLLFQT